MSLKVQLKEEIAMCLRIVAENPNIRIAIMAVKISSKALLALGSGHGKSPCFSQVTFLQLVSPDYSVSNLLCVDGTENMECAL